LSVLGQNAQVVQFVCIIPAQTVHTDCSMLCLTRYGIYKGFNSKSHPQGHFNTLANGAI